MGVGRRREVGFKRFAVWGVLGRVGRLLIREIHLPLVQLIQLLVHSVCHLVQLFPG